MVEATRISYRVAVLESQYVSLTIIIIIIQIRDWVKNILNYRVIINYS